MTEFGDICTVTDEGDDEELLEISHDKILEKLCEAEKKKDLGNAHFKNKEIQQAIKMYHQ